MLVTSLRLRRSLSFQISSCRLQAGPGSFTRHFSTTTPETHPAKVPSKFVNFPFDYHQLVELEIESLTNRGWGLGRVSIESPPKANEEEEEPSETLWVVMVPNVIPGEKVLVSIFRNFKSYSEGDLHSVLTPSPDRVAEPACPFSTECGGCQFQHMTIEAQRRWKTQAVQEALEQYDVHHNVTVLPTLGTTDHVLEYRSKLTPHYQAPSKRQLRETNNTRISAIGFQRKSNRQIIDIPTCRIATPAVNEAYAQARSSLMADPTLRKKGATLLFRQGDNNTVTTQHRDYLTTTVRGRSFVYQAGNFFQNNYYALPLLVDTVRHAVAGFSRLIDCYCGSGLFAISCADLCDEVKGIEINAQAVEEATANAERNPPSSHVSFTAAATPNALFASLSERRRSVVVLDPPRKGCGDDFLQQLLQLGPERIVYVACDVVTQARDVAVLLGHYTIVKIQPIDLFPQTRHIENVIVLDRMEMDHVADNDNNDN